MGVSSDDILSKLVESAVREVVRERGGKGVLEVIGEEEFNKLISSNKFVVTCFYKPECPACKSYMPVFESVSGEFRDVAVFVKVNTKNLKVISKKYNIVALPTTVVFVNGGEVSRYEGSMNAVKLVTFLIASGLKRTSRNDPEE